MKKFVSAMLISMTIFYSSLSLAQSTNIAGGSFVFLALPITCSNEANLSCYLNQPSLAASTILELRKAGVKFFLLPSASIAQMNTMGNAIDQAGGKFLSYEQWPWQSSFVDGQFDCAKYTAERIVPVLLPLKAAHPVSFYGFQFVDEPVSSELQSLGKLKSCLMNQSAFAGMKVFLNLPPVNANKAALDGPRAEADLMTPSSFGVDCINNAVVNRQLSKAMVDRYTEYVGSAISKVGPNILAFDGYPFFSQFDQCTTARDLVMSENMSIISSQSLRKDITPVAYLQNYYTSASSNTANPMEYANFHHLRWYSSWFFVFGGKGFSNFLSHDVRISDSLSFIGLLNSQSNANALLSDQQSTYGMTHQVLAALDGYTYKQFVAPFLGVPTGQVVGWEPSNDLMVGEYAGSSADQAMVFIAERPFGARVDVTIGLNRWWVKIERLDFETGTWQVVGNGTNVIDVTLNAFPGALYRLSMSP